MAEEFSNVDLDVISNVDSRLEDRESASSSTEAPTCEARLINDNAEHFANYSKLQRLLSERGTTRHFLDGVAEMTIAPQLHQLLFTPNRELFPLSTFEDSNGQRFKEGASLSQGDCFFSSMSILLSGHRAALVADLRIGAALTALKNIEQIEKHLLQTFRSPLDVLINNLVDGATTSPPKTMKALLRKEVFNTLTPKNYSGYIQVLFIANVIRRTIIQHVEWAPEDTASIYSSAVEPATIDCVARAAHETPLHILWKGNGFVDNCHCVPLFPVI